MKRINAYFTTYEKIWFVSVLALAVVTSLLFPEESLNGVKGSVLTGLYLADTFLNILCELLISKQSKWNFVVSLGVEVTEILICVLLAYRFATMATTLFFWIPIDVISFINWHRHPDRDDDEITAVRRLSGWSEVIIIAAIIVWTVGVGSLLVKISPDSEVFESSSVEKIVCYLDAFVSAVGICNGVFILLRLEEQWIAWIISSLLEALINIICGQWVLLPLKVGYLTNSTYGYMKWHRYVKQHGTEVKNITL